MLEESPDMYGKEIVVELLKKVRDSKRFDDEDALKRAISEDVKNIVEYFKKV